MEIWATWANLNMFADSFHICSLSLSLSIVRNDCTTARIFTPMWCTCNKGFTAGITSTIVFLILNCRNFQDSFCCPGDHLCIIYFARPLNPDPLLAEAAFVAKLSDGTHKISRCFQGWKLRCLLLSTPWEFGTQRPIANGEALIVPVGWWFSNVFFHSKGAAPTQSNEMWGRSFCKWCSKDSTIFVKQFELLFGYTVTSDMCSYWKHLASDSSDQMTIVNSLIWTRPAFVEFCRIRWYVRAKR